MGTTEEQVVKQKVRKGTKKYLIQTHTLMMMVREREERREESCVSVWFDASGDGRRMRREREKREEQDLQGSLSCFYLLMTRTVSCFWDQSLVGHVICVMLNSPLTVRHFCFLEVNWRDVETRSASRIILETREVYPVVISIALQSFHALIHLSEVKFNLFVIFFLLSILSSLFIASFIFFNLILEDCHRKKNHAYIKWERSWCYMRRNVLHVFMLNPWVTNDEKWVEMPVSFPQSKKTSGRM